MIPHAVAIEESAVIPADCRIDRQGDAAGESKASPDGTDNALLMPMGSTR
jgi:hypothetical protein